MALNPAGIVTPEAVVLDFEIAGLASRGVAKLLDLLIQGAVLLALAVAVGVAVPGTAGVVLLVAGVAAVLLGYPILVETLMRGRSPGKAALGLRVVTVEGAPIAPRHSFVRSTVGLIDFLLPPGGLFAVVASLLSPRSQRLGDLVAGTMVLRERSAVAPPLAVWFSPPAGLEAYAGNLDVSGVTDAQFGVIRSFLLRIGDLTPESRVAMAYRLAEPLREAMRHRLPPGVHPEQFLVAVAAAYQRRHSPPPAAAPTPGAAPPVPAGSPPPPPPPLRAPAPPPPPPPPVVAARPARTRPLTADPDREDT